MDSHIDRRMPSARGAGDAPGLQRRAETLRKGWRRLRDKDHSGLLTLLERLPEEAMLQEPELVYLLATSLRSAGRGPRALSLLRRVTGPGEDRVDSRLIVRCLDLEGTILLSLGELPAAAQCYRKVLETGVLPRDEPFVAAADVQLGIIAGIQSRPAEALACFQRALPLLHHLGFQREIGSVHHYLALTYRQMGLTDEALSSLHRAREIHDRHGSAYDRVRLGVERALIADLAGDHRLARASARAAYRRAARLRRGPAHVPLGRSLDPARIAHHPLLEAEVLEELAILEQAEGDDQRAEVLAERSAAIYHRIGSPARAQRVWGRLRPIEAAAPHGAEGYGRAPYG